MDAWTAGPSKAVSEGHLSAVDPPPRVPRVPKPQVLMYPWLYFPGEGMASWGLGGLGVLGSRGLVFGMNIHPQFIFDHCRPQVPY